MIASSQSDTCVAFQTLLQFERQDSVWFVGDVLGPCIKAVHSLCSTSLVFLVLRAD